MNANRYNASTRDSDKVIKSLRHAGSPVRYRKLGIRILVSDFTTFPTLPYPANTSELPNPQFPGNAENILLQLDMSDLWLILHLLPYHLGALAQGSFKLGNRGGLEFSGGDTIRE